MVNGEFIPYGGDSFYHARRILETIADPAGGFWEFDHRSYAPKGTWHVWPWLFDWGLAHITRAIMWFGGIGDPLAVLTYVPVLFVCINLGLLMGAAGLLGLPLWMRGLAGFAFAMSPLTLVLHMPGRIDHHFIEMTCVLATLYLGLNWLQRPTAIWVAPALGFVLGVAPGLQNGLFILQLPVLSALFVIWARRMERPQRPSVNRFTVALGLSTIAILLPSETFWDGQFFFYTLTGFHLLIAACTIFVAQFMTRRNPTPHNLVLLTVLGLLILVLLTPHLRAGTDFVSGENPTYKSIAEMANLFVFAQTKGLAETAQTYSLLLLTLPVTLLITLTWLFKSPAPERIFFALMVWGGAVLLLLSYRMSYFGSFALYLAPLMAIRVAIERKRRFTWVLGTFLALGYAGANVSAYPLLTRPTPIGGTFTYAWNRSIFPVLEEYCARNPGIVLAPPEVGHFITFHTTCSVLSNLMVLTPQQTEGVNLTKRLLFGVPPESVPSSHPEIKYVLVYGSISPAMNPGETPERTLPSNLFLQLLHGGKDSPHFEPLEQIDVVIGLRAATHAIKLFGVKH